MGGISIFGGRDNSLETMRWIHTLLKGSIRKIYKKSFANNNNDSKINEMLHSVKLENYELLMAKKGLDFTFLHCLKI